MHSAVKDNDCALVNAMFRCRRFSAMELDADFRVPISYIQSVEMLDVFLEHGDGLHNAAFYIILYFDVSSDIKGETLICILEHLLDSKYDYIFGANPIDAALCIKNENLKRRVIELLVKHGAVVEPRMLFTDGMRYVAPFAIKNKTPADLQRDSEYISHRLGGRGRCSHQRLF